MSSGSAHFWALLATKIKLNLRSEVGKNQLSYAWWLLEPTLETAVLYLVFGVFLGQGTDSFVSFFIGWPDPLDLVLEECWQCNDESVRRRLVITQLQDSSGILPASRCGAGRN